jgi:hypothetical protein
VLRQFNLCFVATAAWLVIVMSQYSISNKETTPPCCDFLQVRSFKLSSGPLVGNPKKGGIIDVDGEVIARGEGTYGKSQHQDVMAYGPPIQLTVHQALATVYCPNKIRWRLTLTKKKLPTNLPSFRRKMLR